jgi:ubiquinol-cytochrome c reductase iron-sulfur subunit
MAEQTDLGRRRFLTATCAVVGGSGIATAAIPFLSAFQPSAKALSSGAQLIEVWRKQPVWIIRRSKEILALLEGQNGRLKDATSKVLEQQPKYANNINRSIRPEILVLLGVCTHLGCSPKYHPELKPEAWDSEWKGGFFCPCHGSRFDMAGRVYNGSPA